MPVPSHDRAPQPAPRNGPAGVVASDAGRGAEEMLADAAQRVGAAQRWLVDELRDECSEIGIGARGFDLTAFLEGVAVFAREAARLGAPPERMLVLLKQCLADDKIPSADREQYRLYVDRAVSAAVHAYYAGPPRATGDLRPVAPTA